MTTNHITAYFHALRIVPAARCLHGTPRAPLTRACLQPAAQINNDYTGLSNITHTIWLLKNWAASEKGQADTVEPPSRVPPAPARLAAHHTVRAPPMP